MRLISCYIENFGKISNQTYEFENGLNCICEENGWGKSTIVAFIRVMFYGFLNEKARKGVANERKRFKPWQGGAYGGRLTFETGGTVYEIERSFGTKENEDTYILRDKKTNLPSNDYTKNIGEELFKIDVNSFMRTACISQNDCVTGTTDGINAKIGNLAENTDDINNFESVDKRLTDLLNSMSPTRKTGSIAKLKDEIGDRKVELKNGSELDKTIDEYIALRNEKKREYEELKLRQSELSREKKKISKINDEKLLREKYRIVCEEYDSKKQKTDTLRSFFKDTVPSEEEIDSYISEGTKLSQYENTMNLYELSAEENKSFIRLNKIFEKGENIPDSRELESQLAHISELQEMNIERAKYEVTAEEEINFERLNRHFEKDCPNESDINYQIDRCMLCSEKKNSLAARKAELISMKSNIEKEKAEERFKREQDRQQREHINDEKNELEENLSELEDRWNINQNKTFITALLGLVFVLGGILILILKSVAAGAGSIMVGIVFLILAGVHNSRKNRLRVEIRKVKSELKKISERLNSLDIKNGIEDNTRSDIEGSTQNDNGNSTQKDIGDSTQNDKGDSSRNDNENNIKIDNSIACHFENSLKLLEEEIIQEEALIQRYEEEIADFIKRYHFDSGDQEESYSKNHQKNYAENHVENYAENHVENHTENHVENYTENHANDYIKAHDEDYIKNEPKNYAKILYSMKSDVKEYKRLLSKKEKIKTSQYDNRIKQLHRQIHDFIAGYYDTTDIMSGQYENAIHSIGKDSDNFKMLVQKQDSFAQAQTAYTEGFTKVKEFISKLGISIRNIENQNSSKTAGNLDNTCNAEQLNRIILDIKGHLHQYMLSKEELNEAYQSKLQFEKDNEAAIANFENESLDSRYSMQDIDDNMEKMAKSMEQIQETILYYNNRLNEFREKRDDISEKQEELKLLEEKYESDLHQYKLIKSTKELLEKAKNSFTAKYMEPVMSGFVKYYQIIDGGDTSAFRIDAQTKLTVDEKGGQRETVALSTGRQDLIGICMRMALINAMYTHEKPIVIFDDPFVNLDDDRVKGGINLLEKIADEYQIIYFTCHESRAYTPQ